uniref:Zinc knuckle CX2CX4HX4C domain-containing protein n=1 Tax=Chenopodium quinoa TaxID=63459 RepID=A0A803MZD7_CHEQI
MAGDEQSSEVVLDCSPFWVRLIDVPFNKRKHSVAVDIANALGGFIEYDDSDPLGKEVDMRIKVILALNKPLRRGVEIAMTFNSVKWIDIKYERLGEFCFFCGKLGHIDKEFHDHELEQDEKIVNQYGPYLRASPNRRRNIISMAEKEKQKAWLQSMKKERTRELNYQDPGTIKLGPPSVVRKLLFNSPGWKKSSVDNSTEMKVLKVRAETGEVLGTNSVLAEGIVSENVVQNVDGGVGIGVSMLTGERNGGEGGGLVIWEESIGEGGRVGSDAGDVRERKEAGKIKRKFKRVNSKGRETKTGEGFDTIMQDVIFTKRSRSIEGEVDGDAMVGIQ